MVEELGSSYKMPGQEKELSGLWVTCAYGCGCVQLICLLCGLDLELSLRLAGSILAGLLFVYMLTSARSG